MRNFDWNRLQLFAEGGDGGAAAASGGAEAAGANTGSNPADAEREMLLAAGVPERLIQKGRIYNLPKQAAQTRGAQPAPQESQVASGTEEAPAAETPSRMSWDEIKKDPEYSKEIQALVSRRVKDSKDAQAKLDALRPALEVLARQYKMDFNNLDHAALAKAVNDDDMFYQGMSNDNGLPADVNKRLDQQNRQIRQYEELQQIFWQQQEQARQDAEFSSHVDGLRRQCEELKATFPGVNFDTEMADPTFRTLTAPGGVTFERAYFAMHYPEIMQAGMAEATARGQKAAVSTIMANGRRPVENGSSPHASAVAKRDIRSLTPKERTDILKKMQEATAAGRNVTPEDFL